MIGFSAGAVVLAGVLFLGVLLSVATAVLSKLSGDEISGWLPVWSALLLRSAVEIVPDQYRERYFEEWSAELAAFRDRRISGLAFAWRLRRRARSVNSALLDAPSVAEVFEVEPPPATVALDPRAVAEIVRKVVEKSRPRDDRTGKKVIEDLKASLGDFEVEYLVRKITDRYIEEVSKRRADARASGKEWGPATRWDRLDPWDFTRGAPPQEIGVRRRVRMRRRRRFWR